MTKRAAQERFKGGREDDSRIIISQADYARVPFGDVNL
jgi:hypothetical protein